jgi:hypothetical protein
MSNYALSFLFMRVAFLKQHHFKKYCTTFAFCTQELFLHFFINCIFSKSGTHRRFELKSSLQQCTKITYSEGKFAQMIAKNYL